MKYELLSGKVDQQRAQTIGRMLFNRYDLDRKGTLDKNQCYSIFNDYCYRILNFDNPPNYEEAESMQTVLDYNRDKRVSIEDFEALAMKYLCPTMQLQQKFSASMIEKLKSYKRRPKKYTKATQQRLDVAKRLFTMFDKDRSGYLTEDEIPDILIETYKEMGQNFNPSKDDIRSWMHISDSNRDGRVSFGQFENLVITSLQKCGIEIFE